MAEVAAEAVTSVPRIESYAYPVMLERASMADKARAAHPMVDGNPTRKRRSKRSSRPPCASAGTPRACAGTPSVPTTAAGWVVVHWHAGRSDNHATWEVHTGPRTTTLRAADDAARELLDPSPRPLRTIAEPTAGAALADSSAFDAPSVSRCDRPSPAPAVPVRWARPPVMSAHPRRAGTPPGPVARPIRLRLRARPGRRRPWPPRRRRPGRSFRRLPPPPCRRPRTANRNQPPAGPRR